MRITGLATGLDMDEIVKSSMQPYRIKIQVQQQQKEILEIKQKLYRDVIQESRDFYNKYFDIAKSDSILLSKNWTTVGFTSTNSDVVTVTGSSEAKPGNYTITGSTATAAKAVVTENISEGEKIFVNGKEFELKGSTAKERANNLNEALKSAGINVSVRYSDMASTEVGSDKNKSGFIFESTVLGAGNSFIIGGTLNDIDVVGTPVNGSNATAGKFTGITMDALLSGKLTINDEEVEIKLPQKENGDEVTEEDKLKAINDALKSKKIEVSIDGNKNFIVKSNVLGEIANDNIPKIKINGNEIGTFENGENAIAGSTTVDPEKLSGKVITINGIKVDLSKSKSDEVLSKVNKVFSEQNIGISAENDSSGNIIFTSKRTGENTGIEIKEINQSGNGYVPVTDGKDANIIIRDEKGGVYTHTGNNNTVTIDGITFKFNGQIASGEEIKITGKNDTKEVKDKLVNFINDYNKLVSKLNTLLTEKRDSSYMPLTDEQKEAMSENEIKLWNERVEKGQLKRDSDLTRIANTMKTAMRSMIDGNNLEKFGIEPVSDYQGTKNGTFTVNEDKLTSALENNLEEIMNLFIGTNDDKSKRGIAQQLKDILYNETVTTSSSLIKKAGIEGSATVSNNELTKQITKYTQKMQDMEKDFSRREQLLYSKWASIEKMMNNLNSQQSYFSSMLGY